MYQLTVYTPVDTCDLHLFNVLISWLKVYPVTQLSCFGICQSSSGKFFLLTTFTTLDHKGTCIYVRSN